MCMARRRRAARVAADNAAAVVESETERIRAAALELTRQAAMGPPSALSVMAAARTRVMQAADAAAPGRSFDLTALRGLVGRSSFLGARGGG